MIKMRDSLRCVNILRSEKGIERIGIGIQVSGEGLLIGRIFYMALPPNVFTPVAQGLKKNVYPEKGIARLIVYSQLTLLTIG